MKRGFVIFLNDDGSEIAGLTTVDIEGGIASFEDTVLLTPHGRDVLAGALALALEMVADRRQAS